MLLEKMKESKIALYLGNFNLANGYASIARIYNVSVLLNKYGFKTFVPCFFADKPTFENEFGYNSPLALIDRPIESKTKLYLDYKYYISIIKMYNPKVVFLYDFPSIPAFQIVKYCSKKNIKVIHDCTEWYDSKCVKGILRKIVKKMDVFFRMRIINKKGSGIICVSEYLKKHYSRLNCIKIPPLMSHLNLTFNECKLPTNEDINIFYAGNTNNSKDDIISFIDFLAKEKPSKICFHLFGNNDFLIKKYGNSFLLENHIINHGNICHKELIYLIKNYDCQIIIRKNTRANKAGFPSKFAECTMLNIPCLVTNVGDVSRLVIDEFNGFVTDYRKPDFSNFISKIKSSSISSIKINVSKEKKMFLPDSYFDEFGVFLKKAGVI